MLTVNQLFVLIAVGILKDRSFGNHVAGLIINHTTTSPNYQRGVYVALHRLRDKGLLDQWVIGHGTPRPFYSVTKRGADAVAQLLAEIDAMAKLKSDVLTTIKGERNGKARSRSGQVRGTNPRPAEQAARGANGAVASRRV